MYITCFVKCSMFVESPNRIRQNILDQSIELVKVYSVLKEIRKYHCFNYKNNWCSHK